MAAKLALGIAILTTALVAADIATVSAYESLTSNAAVVIHGFPFIEATVIGCSAMGALIVSRYPRHPIGWLLCVVGLASSFALLTEAYSIWVLHHDGPGSRSLGGLSGWLSTLFGGQFAIALIAVLFLVAPDGRFLSPRWRYAGWVSLAGAAICSAAVLTKAPATFDPLLDGSDYGALASALFSVGFLLIGIGLLCSLLAMLLRLRNSRGEQRSQLRLVAASALLLVLGVVVLFIVQASNGGHQTFASTGLLFVSYMALPLLFAIAVLRYRLYEIDIIINRAVILTIGTAFAGLGYVVLVVVVGAAVNAQTSEYWLSLAATAIVALAFQPLRRRVLRLADRLAYGPRAVPYLALSDFNRRLAEAPAAPMLLPAVAEAAGREVMAARSVVTLELEGGDFSRAEWSSPAVSDDGDGQRCHEVAVRLDNTVLGRISVTPPRGRTFQPVDEVLLRDMADQAAQAFRNLAMEDRLAEHVAALDATTRRLAESRRRIIEAHDAARVRLEAAIARDVLPTLAALPRRLAGVRSTAASDTALGELDGLVSDTNDALESLRDITRGIFPAQLARAGLGPALRTLLARNGFDRVLTVDDSVVGLRFTPRVEAAVFFCCAEVLERSDQRLSQRSAQVSAQPTQVTLALDGDGDHLVLTIDCTDVDQVDLQPVTDRVEAAGGTVVRETPGVLTVRAPSGSRPPTPR